MLVSSHQFSHTHDRHNKEKVLSVEEYCDIIAKMKSSHDPKMQVVSHILSGADFPPLNKAAHDVKSDVCRTGGNKSTQRGAGSEACGLKSWRNGLGNYTNCVRS